MATEQPLFSVVMPTFGVERYIADAIADMLTQTFADFELIVVDDASRDHSIQIVEDLAGEDPRVRIVRHPHNRGLSATRNTGIAEARGTWVMFPDPDDRYEPTMLAHMAESISAHNPDLVIFNHSQEYFDRNGTYLYSNPLPLVDARYRGADQLGRAALRLETDTHLGYAWNKAYRLEVIRQHQLAFEEDAPLIEDILFNIAYLKHVDSLVTRSSVEYHYAKRLGANLTNAYEPAYYVLHRRRIQELYDLLEGFECLDDQAKETLGALYARYILSALERQCSKQAQHCFEQRVRWVQELFDDPLFNELIPLAQARDSKALAFCLRPLRERSILRLLALGRLIHVVHDGSTTLYTKVKSQR